MMIFGRARRGGGAAHAKPPRVLMRDDKAQQAPIFRAALSPPCYYAFEAGEVSRRITEL